MEYVYAWLLKTNHLAWWLQCSFLPSKSLYQIVLMFPSSLPKTEAIAEYLPLCCGASVPRIPRDVPARSRDHTTSGQSRGARQKLGHRCNPAPSRSLANRQTRGLRGPRKISGSPKAEKCEKLKLDVSSFLASVPLLLLACDDKMCMRWGEYLTLICLTQGGETRGWLSTQVSLEFSEQHFSLFWWKLPAICIEYSYRTFRNCTFFFNCAV